jgi:hypothetical protein
VTNVHPHFQSLSAFAAAALGCVARVHIIRTSDGLPKSKRGASTLPWAMPTNGRGISL